MIGILSLPAYVLIYSFYELPETVAMSRNGNPLRPSELDPGVEKIVVIGEPGVGKTSFIQAYYEHHEPLGIDSHLGVTWYSCEFTCEGQRRRAALFEIPGDPDYNLEQKLNHYEDAKVIVFMYAVDDPPSLESIIDRWIHETREIIFRKKIPAVLVGNKKDLRSNPQVISRLATNNEEPLTFEQGRYFLILEEIKSFVEISSLNSEDVNGAFELIFNHIVH